MDVRAPIGFWNQEIGHICRSGDQEIGHISPGLEMCTLSIALAPRYCLNEACRRPPSCNTTRWGCPSAPSWSPSPRPSVPRLSPHRTATPAIPPSRRPHCLRNDLSGWGTVRVVTLSHHQMAAKCECGTCWLACSIALTALSSPIFLPFPRVPKLHRKGHAEGQ